MEKMQRRPQSCATSFSNVCHLRIGYSEVMDDEKPSGALSAGGSGGLLGIQLFLHLTKRGDYILFRVQRRADGCKKMGILWCDNVFVIQLESTDKRFSQFREEMKRSTEESNMSADWFSAGKTTDGLVYDCLKNRSR